MNQTLEEIADFWDTHSLADYWDQTHEVQFEVRATRRRRITLDPDVYSWVEAQAHSRGVSPETLVNLWLVERLQKTAEHWATVAKRTTNEGQTHRHIVCDLERHRKGFKVLLSVLGSPESSQPTFRPAPLSRKPIPMWWSSRASSARTRPAATRAARTIRGISGAQQAQWLAEAASLSIKSGIVRLMILWNVDYLEYGEDPMAGYAIIRPVNSCPACEALHAVVKPRWLCGVRWRRVLFDLPIHTAF
jgi:hypothetical protein